MSKQRPFAQRLLEAASWATIVFAWQLHCGDAYAGQVPNPINAPNTIGAGHFYCNPGGFNPQQASDCAPPTSSPGGSSGQQQYNNSGTLGGFTETGDVTVNTSTGVSVVGAVNGVAYPASPSTHTTPVVTGSGVVTYKGLPNCLDSAGQHLNYNTGTDLYSCGSTSGPATPGGSSGQEQYNNSGALGGFTMGGDATLNTATGVIIVTKTNGVAFAPSATTDTTNAGNITSGTLPNARLVSIPNSALANSAVTVNGVSISLGASGTITAAPSGSASGDLGSTYPGPTVVSVAHVTTGVLGTANGGTGNTTGAPSGSASGDLSGSYPGPTVGKVNGGTPGNTCPAHQYETSINTSAQGSCGTVAFTDVTGTSQIAQGGTGQTTAPTAIGCSGLGVICPTTHGDSNYSIASTDRLIELSATLSAPRTFTLPSFSSVAEGTQLRVIDPGNTGIGFISPTNNLTLIPNSGDSIAGDTNANVVATAPFSTIFIERAASTWKVHISSPPARTLDAVADFGLVPADVLGNYGCTWTAASTTVNCGTDVNIPPEAITRGDLAIGQFVGASGHDLVTYVTGVGTHSFTVNTAPTYTSTSLKALYKVASSNKGTGYKFGSTECASGGSIINNLCVTNQLMEATSAIRRANGTGGSAGTCHFALKPVGDYALQGVEAVFTATISGGALTGTPTLISGSQYSLMGSYTYDSSGYYEAIPVVQAPGFTDCGALTGATVDVKFGVNQPQIVGIPIYQSGTPCGPSTAVTMTNPDHGDGNFSVTCNTHNAQTSVGYDNGLTKLPAMYDFLTAQINAKNPVCVKWPTAPFIASPVPVATHPINGPPCMKFDNNIFTPIFIVPNSSAGTEIFPIVDANGGGSVGQGAFENSWGDTTQNITGGTLFDNPFCQSTLESTTYPGCIRFYGFTQWFEINSPMGVTMRGCMVCTGADAATGNGTISEGTVRNARTWSVGDASVSSPIFGFDSMGSGGSGANNIEFERGRFYQPRGVPIRYQPCSGGNGAHGDNIWGPKIEWSQMDSFPVTPNGIQIGENHCSGQTYYKSDGTTTTGVADGTGGGASHFNIIGLGLVNPAGLTSGVILEGNAQGDIAQMKITGQCGDSKPNGRCFTIQAAGNAVSIDFTQCSADDYCMYVNSYPNAGQIASDAIDVDFHNTSPPIFADAGIDILGAFRCSAITPLLNCTGATGSLVDTGSTQTVTGKTLSGLSNTFTNLPANQLVGTIAAHTYIGNNTGSSGPVGQFQPACADLSDNGPGCNGLSVVNHRFLGNNSGSTATATFVRPACSDLSDSVAFCNSTDAANLTGTVAAARMNPSILAHQYLGNNTSISVAAAFVRPVCADLSDSGNGCPNTAVSNHFFLGNSSGSSAAPVFVQPAATDITGLAASATIDTTNASNISSGTLAAARMNPTVSGHTYLGNNTGSSTAAAFVQPKCSDLSDAGNFCSGNNAANLTGTIPASVMNPSVSAHTYLGNNTTGSAAAAFVQPSVLDNTGWPAGYGTRWTMPIVYGSFAAGTAEAASTVVCSPGYVLQKLTPASLGALTTTTSSTNHVSLAVYNVSTTTGKPTTEVGDTGSITLGASAGQINGTMTTQFGPGLYMFCENSDNAVVVFSSYVLTAPTSFSFFIGTTGQAGALGATNLTCGWSTSQTFGTWGDLTGNTWAAVAAATCPKMGYNINSVP